jgi:hypothetical protein
MYIGDLATDRDKAFNWFICSKRYLDPKTDLYVAELGVGTRFYDNETGHTYVIPKRKDPTKMLIVDDLPLELQDKAKRISKKYRYQGIVKRKACELENPDAFFLCDDVEFGFFSIGKEENGIIISKKEHLCEMLEFARRNNTLIRMKHPDFPTVAEIEKRLETEGCHTVCKNIYGDLYDFCEKR